MTTDQIAANSSAANELVRGMYYRFDPPVTATGFPTGERRVCLQRELQFNRGWYIGFVDGKHVFQGKPLNDPRTMMAPQGYESHPDLAAILEQLRECYFHVLFVGGSAATLDADQSH